MGAIDTVSDDTKDASPTALDVANGLRELARSLEAQPYTEFADAITSALTGAGIGLYTHSGPRFAALLDHIGAEAPTEVTDTHYLVAETAYGPVRISVRGWAASVAERRVVGTKTVDVEEWVVPTLDGAS